MTLGLTAQSFFVIITLTNERGKTMTKEKALEKIEIIYKLNGDFDHATKYITGLYGLTPDFWKENFDFISSKMIAKYPNLYYGGIV